MMQEIECHEDNVELEYKFTIVGTYIGDKDEIVNQKRVINILSLTDNNSAWELLSDADFEIKEA